MLAVGQRQAAPRMLPRQYTVLSGDSLSAIAQRHGLSLNELVALNPQLKGRSLDLIQPGEHLNLGSQSPAPQGPAKKTTPDAPGGAPAPTPSKVGALGGMVGLGGLSGFGVLGAQVPAKVSETPGYAKLSPAVKQQVDGLATDKASGAVLAGLVNSKGFGQLDAGQQRKTLAVFKESDLGGRFALTGLMNKELNGKTVALDPDAQGNTLIDNLHRMATSPRDAEFAQHGVSKQGLLSSTIAESSRPGEINQSSKGTCTVTSMQQALTARNPAEYVRLMDGLTGPGGEVKLRNGDTLRRDAGSVAPDSATTRSPTERVFQAAMMEYSNGALRDYDNATDKNIIRGGAAGRWGSKFLGVKAETGGLNVHGMKRGFDGLFGTDSKLTTGNSSEMITRLEGQKPNTALLSFRWSNNGADGHAVTFDRIENGRLYFRNPWGRNFDAAGSSKDPPPRKIEDGFTGLESMSLAEAKSRLIGFIQE
ncbi:MAG: LysM peptidoglycan-binding domain-containing protein [Deltaproteobacteria bacterium]|nr:LysM peptidoglycan-binding domain-containing protein [Deltaproteobacteria bacterium]